MRRLSAIAFGWGLVPLVHNWVPPSGPAIYNNFQANGTVTPFNAVLNIPPYNGGNPVGAGQIAMQYQDDAAISYASLELTCGPSSVGGTADLLTNTDSADNAADVSGSSIASDYTAPVAAAIAAAVVVLALSGWYTRRRWMR